MNQEKGKFTIVTLLITLLLICGGYAAFKYFSTTLTKKEIKKTIFNAIGTVRGSSVPESQLIETIAKVLKDREVKFDPEDIDAVIEKGVISFYYRYIIETDYILFKAKEEIEVEDKMDAYGY